MATTNVTTAGDGELLAVFVSQQRHEAFEEILRRHGGMVMGVCRSVLGGGPDAEDAAQATFLALVRKAASLRQHPTLAGWLHRVAWYAAAQERKSIKARTRHEREAANMKYESGQMNDENIPMDLLHAGLAKLPDKYRLPIVLHHLEGRSQEEVAGLLVQNVRTIASRLNRGRQMLRDRLLKTGTVVSATALVAAIATQASAGISTAFAASVTKMAALSLTAKAAAAGAASAKVLAISKGALNMVFIAKMKVAALLTAAVCLVGATAAGTYVAVAAGPREQTAKPPPKADSPKVETIAPANSSTPTPSSAGKVTVVEITDKVLVKDVSRFGINLSSDKYYSGAVMVKKRVQDNFEGTLYRQCHFGPMDANGVATWFKLSPDWQKILLDGGTYTVLSGSSKQTTGKIKAITTKDFDGKPWPYFELDKEIQPLPYPKTGGILVENLQRIREGQMPIIPTPLTSKSNEIVTGDTPPGSFGCAALCLKPENGGEAIISYHTHYQRFGENNGLWHVDFWAKKKEGSPKFTIRFLVPGGETPANQDVELTDQWKKYQLTMKIEGVAEPRSAELKGEVSPQFAFVAAGGQVLLDDVEAWLEGDKNPTVFRDEVVETLKKFNPGSIRYLQMGGDTLENTIMPPLKAYSHDSQSVAKSGPENRHLRNDFSLHETYQLSEYIDSEPWYCLPGTLHHDEIKAFMEYIGGPVDTKYGKLRADLGHPKPWTETLKRIHVEFGNEAWNNAVGYKCGGFNGQDYWKDLIATAKASPYYKPNVIFHAGTQAANTGKTEQICGYVPNADRIAIAPYILGHFLNDDAAALDSDDKLFRWAFAWPIQRSLNEAGSDYQTYKITSKAGIELSIYEINHHITMDDGPLEPRNRITTSLAGGVNVANTMLIMLKHHGVRTQNLFALIQMGFKAKVGVVRLWGTALNMRKGKERYRPTFLTCAAANKVLSGNLVETVHGGADPTFQAVGKMEDIKKGIQTIDGNKTIWSYAFSDGKKRGLILINLDLKTALPVELKFQGKPKGTATCWTVAADNPAASNEFENEKPQVETAESQVELQSGGKLTLPPCSMKAFAWEVE